MEKERERESKQREIESERESDRLPRLESFLSMECGSRDCRTDLQICRLSDSMRFTHSTETKCVTCDWKLAARKI